MFGPGTVDHNQWTWCKQWSLKTAEKPLTTKNTKDTKAGKDLGVSPFVSFVFFVVKGFGMIWDEFSFDALLYWGVGHRDLQL
jgi:hypothetical protein